jgi:hypothetical protein
MFKTFIKLLIVAAIANAAWRIGSAYYAMYRFRDAVQETAQFNSQRDDDWLEERVVELGRQYDVPIEDNFTLRRDNYHIIVDGAYTQELEVFPGYKYPWKFEYHVDTLSTQALTAPSSR